ncbi:transketolase [Patescibacteria group bacterium]|nr:transketolase [Patescibacteria group bacterium]
MKTIKQMEKIACVIRQDIIKMLEKAGSGHSAGSLGMADVFTALYFSGVVKHNPKKPNWSERDRIVLSNAHICPVQYAVLARAGYFPLKKLSTLRKLGSSLQGHPHKDSLAGIEASGGPIGHNTSVAVGMAYSFKMDGKRNQVYCLVGDGGQDEGQVWEANMFAAKHKLDNLTFIMDRNNIQIDGYTEDVMPLEPLRAKYEAFNWHVIDVNGHSIKAIVDAIEQAKAIYEKPVMILAHTIPGKGVNFMEWEYSWHGRTPKEQEARDALRQLRTLGGKIKSEDE